VKTGAPAATSGVKIGALAAPAAYKSNCAPSKDAALYLALSQC